MTQRSSFVAPLVLIVSLGCSGRLDSSGTSSTTGGDGADAFNGSGGAAAGATSTAGATEQRGGVWMTSSVGVEVRHSWGSAWLSPDAAVTHSSSTCYAISRDRMSSEQLKFLDALLLVKSTPCYLCDAWDDYDLTVIDNGSQVTYAGPHCNCTEASTGTIVGAEFFASFPLDGAEACPQ